MKSFIDKTIKPFLVIAGLGTCVSGLLVFSPQFAIENIFKLPFAEDLYHLLPALEFVGLIGRHLHDYICVQSFMAYAYPDLQRH